jgi:hypothetical protein
MSTRVGTHTTGARSSALSAEAGSPTRDKDTYRTLVASGLNIEWLHRDDVRRRGAQDLDWPWRHTERREHRGWMES